MQRYSLNLKGGNYAEGNVYRLLPIFRQQVVPGQTVNLDFEVSLKTAAMTKNLTTPCLMSVWFFYVPHRLSWSDWPDFISKADGAPSFPLTTNSANFFDLSNGGTVINPLFRRAFKLCYNEYFGSENIGSGDLCWYDDPTDDTVTTLYRTKNPEDFISKIQLEASVVDPEFSVSGATIPLNDFYRQMMNARSQQRSQMTGDKYVDTLARMGVDATWMIAERPEFLGTKSMLVGPQLTANTTGTDAAYETARYSSNLSCSIKGKHFAEHGYIVGVSSVRPLVVGAGRGAPDVIATSPDGSWIDSFYSADNLETKDVATAEAQGFTGDDGFTQRFGYLNNGAWLKGEGGEWCIKMTYNNFKEMIYPSDAQIPVSNEIDNGNKDYAATVSYKITGKTPVPKRVA